MDRQLPGFRHCLPNLLEAQIIKLQVEKFLSTVTRPK